MVDMEKVNEIAQQHFAAAGLREDQVFLQMDYMTAMAVFAALQKEYKSSRGRVSEPIRDLIRKAAGGLQDSLKLSEETGIVLEMGWHDVDATTEHH